MANFNFDQDKAVALVRHQQSLIDATNKFAKVGVDRIRECGITGGGQAAKIEELTRVIEEKFQEAISFNESLTEGIESVIVNIGNFDMQTILNKATEQVDNIEKAEKVTAKKVNFA